MLSVAFFPPVFPVKGFLCFQRDQRVDCREKVLLQTFLGHSCLWIWGPLIDFISPTAASWVSWMVLYSNTSSPFCAWLCTQLWANISHGGWGLFREAAHSSKPLLWEDILEATILVWCMHASVFHVFPNWELRLFSPWLQEGEGQNLKLGIPLNRMNTYFSTFCVCFLFLVYSRRKYS